MKGRRISQVVLVVEIVLIVLLHVNKSNHAEKPVANRAQSVPVATGSTAVGVLTGLYK
jgi:hypothetical protein